MDNAARWFLAGIIVSLINTGLVIAFLGIPDDLIDRGSSNTEVQIVEVASPPVTYIVVVDPDGNVLVERTALDAGASVAEAAAMAMSGQTLQFAAATFAQIARPTFVSAQNGVAYVTSQGKFELWSVALDGETERVDLEGIDNLGSIVMDVDVTTNGTLYLLVSDGVFDWRIYRGGADNWSQIASSILSGWPGQLIGLSVADNEALYLTATEPAGVFRLVPPFRQINDWVPGNGALGVDVAADEGLLVYAAPDTDPSNPLAQVGYVRDGRFGNWQSTYAGCGSDAEMLAMATATATATATADAEATAAAADAVEKSPVVGPKFPRDVAIVDSDRIIVVDSLSHIVRVQQWDGGSVDIFGTACEQGGDSTHLLNPRGVAIDGSGNVFITDTANNRVVVLAAR